MSLLFVEPSVSPVFILLNVYFWRCIKDNTHQLLITAIKSVDRMKQCAEETQLKLLSFEFTCTKQDICMCLLFSNPLSIKME